MSEGSLYDVLYDVRLNEVNPEGSRTSNTT